MADNHAQDHDRNLEQLLDAHLAARMQGAEPRSGLEERVLARLASEPKSRPVISWRWAFAAFAALGLISIALLVVRTNAPEKPHLTRKTEPAATSTQVAKVEPQVSAPHGKSIRRQYVLAVSRRSATRQKEVTAKLATFPAPTPETDQERMLARLAAQRGSFELAREAPDPAIKDLQLKELAVEPLEGTPPDIAQ